MTSPVDICQEALNEIGSRSTLTSLTDPTPQANACQRAYDVSRRQLLRTAPWNFARRQVTLTLLGTANTGDSVFPFMYKYAYPSDCVKFRYLLQVPAGWPFPADPTVPQTGDALMFPYYPVSRRAKFMIASGKNTLGHVEPIILTDISQAIGVYSYDVKDPDQFDSMFWEALVGLVAEKLIMPLTGNVQMKGQFYPLVKERVMEARAADGNEGLPTTDHTPDWIQVRGFQADYYYSGMPAFPGIYGESWDNLAWGD